MDKEIMYAGFAIAGFVISKALDFMLDDRKNQKDKVMENTTAVRELTIEIKHIKIALELMPSLKRDIDMAHEKIRDINGRV